MRTAVCILFVSAAAMLAAPPRAATDQALRVTPGEVLRVGAQLPDATMIATDGRRVRLRGTSRRARILSIVPQLNTPVCDEQTHRFSEDNGGLDQLVDIVTLSTNTPEDQARFAGQAGIANVTFLSDRPAYDFGTRTGLLIPMLQVLHRAVIVVDAGHVIRYVEIVPMGQLPNFDAAYEAARRLADHG